MSGNKRKADAGPSSNKKSDAKKPQIHSFFTGGVKEIGNFLPSPPTLIHYLHNDPFSSASAPGPSTLLSPIPSSSGVSSSRKISIVFYDLDGTLIKPRSGAPFPKGRDDWMWWHPSIPDRLKREVGEGKHLVVISNQGSSDVNKRAEWKAKVSLIAGKIPDLPLRVLAGTSMVDIYRKPNIGMYQVVEKLYREKGFEIDKETSVFVGDAAGRIAGGGKRKDHSNTDYQFAINAGLRFVTPEVSTIWVKVNGKELFLGMPRPAFPEPPVGFRPSLLGSLAALPPIVPSNTPITREEIEIVIFVGMPATGKTSFFRRHFLPAGYEHVNQDTLGTRDRCLLRAETLVKSGKSVVIDNTNRNKAVRAVWINLAERLNVPIRLFHFLCPIELAIHNNMYRAVYAPKEIPARTLLPVSAFWSFKTDFQVPEKSEGFDEIRGVNFAWGGTEEQRRLWDMYMLITR